MSAVGHEFPEMYPSPELWLFQATKYIHTPTPHVSNPCIQYVNARDRLLGCAGIEYTLAREGPSRQQTYQFPGVSFTTQVNLTTAAAPALVNRAAKRSKWEKSCEHAVSMPGRNNNILSRTKESNACCEMPRDSGHSCEVMNETCFENSLPSSPLPSHACPAGTHRLSANNVADVALLYRTFVMGS
jgi:hypothetical protein